MLLHKESLNELRQRFKLNIYEVKIWTSLLSRGIAAASELAEISGVPRSRCYDVLESLEKKGFIIMKIGKPIKYIAVQPEAVMDRVKKRLQEDAEQQIQTVNNADLARQCMDSTKQRRRCRNAQSLRAKDAVRGPRSPSACAARLGVVLAGADKAPC